MTVDPVTVEVLRNYLQRVAEEMEATVVRTAYSIGIYYSYDFACGILDPDANVLAGSLGTPVMIHALPNAIKASYEHVGAQNIEPEDVLFCNDPYSGGGTHGNDVVGIYPVFADDRLIGFTAFKGHVTDMGGMWPSGYFNNTNEIYQELFRVPPVKLYKRGKENDDVLRLITANSRAPEELMGDLRAIVSGVRTGGHRLRQLLSKYSYETFHEAVQIILNQSEKIAATELSKIPEGQYEGEFLLDGDGDDNSPISRAMKVHMAVTIKEGRMTIDLSQSSPQSAGPMNSPKSNTISYARMAFKSLIDPFSPINEGSFRILNVIVKRGTMYDPIPPAPTALWIEAAQGLTDLLFKVLSTAMPERTCGATFGSDIVDFIYGTNPRNNRFYALVDTLQGGWGANASSDGATLYAVSEGTATYPMVEMLEATYPLIVRRWELVQDSGGPGQLRGGLGVRREYEITHDCHITHCYERCELSPPWGVLGGKAGSMNYVEYNWKGTLEKHAKVTHRALRKGEVIAFVTGGGGGYGNPLERQEDHVLQDVLLGYVSKLRAQEDYGVVLDLQERRVDEQATHELRTKKKIAAVTRS